MKHTPEPWRECGKDRDDGCKCRMVWALTADVVVAMALMADDEDYTGGEGISSLDMAKANAARIAACVNALAGVEEPEKDLQAARLKLEFITQGAGAYSRDPLEHARNCVEEMKEAAREALKLLGGK